MRKFAYKLFWLNWINPVFYVIVTIYYLMLVAAMFLGLIYRRTRMSWAVSELLFKLALYRVKFDSQWCREVYQNIHRMPWDKAPKKRARMIKAACQMRLANIKKVQKGLIK